MANRSAKNYYRMIQALVLSSLLVLTACSSEIYSGLSEREANEMVRVLLDSGIDASRKADGDDKYAVSVERGKIAAALAELSRAGLPAQNFGSLGDMFASDKLVSTPFEERARFMHAINQEMSNSLSQIAGVTSARVFINVPEQSPLDNSPAVPRASVFIYKNPDVDLKPIVPTIKNLIVNSMDGLQYENVEVAIFDGANAVKREKSAFSGTTPVSNNLTLLVFLVVLLFGGLYLRSKLLGGRVKTADIASRPVGYEAAGRGNGRIGR